MLSKTKKPVPRFAILTLGVLILSFASIATIYGNDTHFSDQPRSNKSKAPSDELTVDNAAAFQNWLDEDVAYIITNQERATFLKLSSDEERFQFIEQFWLRRDPTPDTRENEFKQEHYRRIAYSNEHFGTKNVLGWKSDRGRIYVLWGKPDGLDTDRDCASLAKLGTEIAGGLTGCVPHEIWHYNYLEGIGADVDLLFVDAVGSGDYKLATTIADPDVILELSCGYGSKDCDPSEEFNRLRSFLPGIESPPVKSKELEETLNAGIGRNELAFNYRSDSIRATKFTTIFPITIEVPDREFTFHDEDGTAIARINLLGRITTADGSVADMFENSIFRKLPEKPDDSGQTKVPVYQYMALLRPGTYQLEIVVQDVASGRVGMINAALRVSTFENSRAATPEERHFSATTNCSPIGGVCSTHALKPALPNIF